MKAVLLLLSLLFFSVRVCSAQNIAKMLKNENQKKQIFNTILSDEKLSGEMMDSLMKRKHTAMMMKMRGGQDEEKQMKMQMMQKMMKPSKDTCMCMLMMREMMEKRSEGMQKKPEGGEKKSKGEEHSEHHTP